VRTFLEKYLCTMYSAVYNVQYTVQGILNVYSGYQTQSSGYNALAKGYQGTDCEGYQKNQVDSWQLFS